jgi:hypothetical protein
VTKGWSGFHHGFWSPVGRRIFHVDIARSGGKREKSLNRKGEKEKEINLTIGKRHSIRTAVVQHGYRYILIKRETCG